MLFNIFSLLITRRQVQYFEVNFKRGFLRTVGLWGRVKTLDTLAFSDIQNHKFEINFLNVVIDLTYA